MTNSRSVIICCGGGTDSTALIDYYLELDYTVHGVHFDYGQIALPGERQAVEALSKYYQVPILPGTLRPKLKVGPGQECKGRNALFVLFAAQFLENQQGLISLGIHAGTPYYDCSLSFVQRMQWLLDGYFDGTVVLDTPFLDFHKRDVYAYCKLHDVPVDLTYSCQRHPHTPCGVCTSCQDRSHYDTGF